jgi:hypothetical protein
VHVGKGGSRDRDPLLEPLTPRCLVRNRVVIDGIGCDEPVEGVGVTPADRVDDAPIDVLVLVRRRRR